MTKNELSVPHMKDADVYKSSASKLLLLIPKSRSKNHSLALKYAGLVESIQVYVEEQLFTICYIDIGIARNCEIASKIINLAQGWKGFAVVYKGKTISSFHLSYRLLPCIIKATQCNSKKAHCSQRVNGNAYIKNHGFANYRICDFDLIIPCKLADVGFYEPALDVPINEQYQAMAVELGVHWCPFFNADNIQIIDVPKSSPSKSNDFDMQVSGASAILSIDISDLLDKN